MSINITISGELIVTHEKDTSYNDAGATATDGSNNFIVDISFNNLNVNQVGDYQIIYKATDNSNNTVTSSRTINVVDTTPPVVTLLGDNPIIIQKYESFNDPGLSVNEPNDISSVIFSASNESLIYNSNNVSDNSGSYIMRYTVSDLSGNITTIDRNITIKDDSSPLIILNGYNPVYIQKDTIYNDSGASLAGGYQSYYLLVNESNNVDTTKIGNYKLFYKANNTSSSNQYVTHIRHVYVRDANIPVISISGENPIIIPKNIPFNDPGLIPLTDASYNIVFNNVDISKNGHYGIVYTGNNSTNFITTDMRIIRVSNSNPVALYLNTENPYYIYKNTTFDVNNALTSGTNLNIVFNNVDTTKNGNYGVVYTATDANNENLNTVFLEVRVRDVITTLIGSNSYYLQNGAVYNDPGVITQDVSGNIYNTNIDTSDIINNTNNDYIVTYSNNSFAKTGSISDDIYRIVFVRDNIDSTLNLECLTRETNVNIILTNGNKWVLNDNTQYKQHYGVGIGQYILKDIPQSHPMAILCDSSNVNYTGDISKNSTMDISGVTYNFYYGDIVLNVNDTFTNASLYCFNHGFMGGENMLLYSDTCDLPYIDISGDNPLIIEKNSTYNELNASVPDGYTLTIDSSNVNTQQVGSYFVNYTANNTSNNTLEATRAVIVKDRTPPIISISGENPTIVFLDNSYNDAGASNINSLPITVSFNNVNTNVIGDYLVIYTTTDICGNKASATRRVFVRDPSYAVITNSGEAGAIGDPYVTTIDGEIYKIDNMSGNVRLLQGYYKNKLFTFNAELKLLNDEKFDKFLNWKKKKIKKREFSKNFSYGERPAYFSRYFISWGDKYFILGSKKLTFKENNYDVISHKDTKLTNEYPWSNKVSKATNLLIDFDDISITFKSYKNKDINNGFTINNPKLITNRTGLLEHTLYTQDATIKNIKNIEPIKITNNRKYKKIIKEEFIENNNSKILNIKLF